MRRKQSKAHNLSVRDRFQIAAFQTHFKLNINNGMEPIVALGMAVAATSDDATSDALAKRPTAIQDWQTLTKNCRGMVKWQ